MDQVGRGQKGQQFLHTHFALTFQKKETKPKNNISNNKKPLTRKEFLYLPTFYLKISETCQFLFIPC